MRSVWQKWDWLWLKEQQRYHWHHHDDRVGKDDVASIVKEQLPPVARTCCGGWTASKYDRILSNQTTRQSSYRDSWSEEVQFLSLSFHVDLAVLDSSTGGQVSTRMTNMIFHYTHFWFLRKINQTNQIFVLKFCCVWVWGLNEVGCPRNQISHRGFKSIRRVPSHRRQRNLINSPETNSNLLFGSFQHYTLKQQRPTEAKFAKENIFAKTGWFGCTQVDKGF